MEVNDFMSVVDWSRAQFAMTAIYHWLFVPLTLGLGFIIAFMETIYYKTGDEFWKRTTKFWMRLFGINFAIGVATGIILEFEFGTNWSNYSHFVGDIFGAPLAIEGIMAFFMESTFIAIMFFGWNKVSKGFHLAATWLTAIGANLSALWILVANAWMQYPAGTAFSVETARNEMTSFWDVLLSPVAIDKFLHTTTSGYVLASVFVVGVSAWFLLRRRDRRMARCSMVIASVFGLVSAVFLAFTGDSSGVDIARTQPMKLAAMEAHYDGEHGAPLVAFGILRPEAGRTNNDDAFYWKIQIPKLLSVMSFHDADAFVPGINDLLDGNPEQGILSTREKIDRGRVAIGELAVYRDAKQRGDTAAMQAVIGKFDASTAEGRTFLDEYYRYFGYGYLSSPGQTVPDVPLVFYSFRVMVGAGIYFIALFAVLLVLLYRRTIEHRRWLLWVTLWSIPLAYIASQAGWIVAEVGRQPWVVQNLLPTVAAVSRIDAGSVMVTFFIFVALFTTLLIAEVMIMTRQIRIGPDKPEKK
ncbi:MAG: cytochrome ubiquinol oxidase subunit I [Rikenellaceae bacterium]|nr:cytochrome ubiquinol oxidase subunit I [Rikenellaceae bacterium]